MKTIDLIGRRFGRLTVTGFSHIKVFASGNRRYMWECSCDCGGTKVAMGNHLRDGATTSCGCFQKEQTSAGTTKHGLSKLPEYAIWVGMLNRCRNPKVKSFETYGAIGVTVCDRWHDFPAFYADMGPRPSRTHSIDRIDVYRGYDPANCRWATPKEQANNRRPRVKKAG